MENQEYETNTFRQGQERMKQAISSIDQDIRNPSNLDETCNLSIVDISITSSQQQQIPNNDQSMVRYSFSHNNIQREEDTFNVQQERPSNISINATKFLVHQDLQKDQPSIAIENSYIQFQPQQKGVNPSMLDMSNQALSKKLPQLKKNQITSENSNSYIFNSQFQSSIIKRPNKIKQGDTKSVLSLQPKELSISKLKVNGIMQTIKYIKKFINKLKLTSKKVLFRSISRPQFDIINDISSEYEYYLFSGFIFHHKEAYSNGMVIRDRYDIFKSNFWNIMKDLFILTLYTFSQIEGEKSGVKYLDYVIFIKYIDIPSKVSEFEIKLQLNDSIKNWMKLMKLEVTVLILAHVACCIFLDIGQYEYRNNQENWINRFLSDDQSIMQQYLTSLYFMVITVCTIGYGDLFPSTFYERGFMIMVAILSTNITAYAFSQISEIVKFEDSKNENFNKLMIGMNHQMKISGLSMNLQQKVRKFYEFFNEQNQYMTSFSDQYINQLPSHLKEKVLLELNKDNINSINLFKNLSLQCQERVSLSMKQKQLLPGEIILKENELNECLFFVNQGNLEVYSTLRINHSEDSIGTKFQQLKVKQPQIFNIKKDVFGYEGFLLGEVSPYFVKSQGSTIVSYIERQNFLDIVMQFPNDKEIYQFIKDQAIFGAVYTNLYKLKCISCGIQDHQLSQCPYVSLSIKYKPSKQINSRNKQYLRKRERFHNLLMKMKYIQEQAMEAVANNDEDLILEALTIFQSSSLLAREDEDDDDENYGQINSSLSFSIQKNRNSAPNLEEVQNSLREESLSKRRFNTTSQENSPYKKSSLKIQRDFHEVDSQKRKINRTISFRQEEKEKQNEQRFNFHFESGDEKDNENDSQSKMQRYDSLDISQGKRQNNPLSERKVRTSSIKLTKNSEDQREKILQLSEKMNNDQTNSSISEKHSSIKTSQYQKLQINNSTNQQQQRQKKSMGEFKYFQKKINERIKQQNLASLSDILTEVKNFQNNNKDRVRSKSLLDSQELEKPEKKLLSIVSFLAESMVNNKQKNLGIDNFFILSRTLKSQINTKQKKNLNEMKDENQQKSQKEQINCTNENQSTQQSRKQSESYQNSSEYKIRCQLNLQDIDMLVVRKQFMMMQQRNQIQNYIEVPDNEMDIDILHHYKFYYKPHNMTTIIHKFRQGSQSKGRPSNSQRKKTQSSRVRGSKNKQPLSFPKFNRLSSLLKLSLKNSIEQH